MCFAGADIRRGYSSAAAMRNGAIPFASFSTTRSLR
jgi:hypothetical protein